MTASVYEVPDDCPYVIQSELGQGGMAIVYKALGPAGDVVALKLPRALVGMDGAKRLRREIDVQTQLAHPHIMPILDFSRGNGEPWFTMPVADGTLKQLWPDAGTTLRQLIVGLAGGLDHAHDAGYLHRDISPGNILRLSDGRWVVADWGVVRRPRGQTTQLLTTEGGWGTAGYSAPELQTDSPHNATAAADVYSLGRVAARLLTGIDPQPNLPLLPQGPWRGIIAEATAAQANKRPSSMSEFVALVERSLDDNPVSDTERIDSELRRSDWNPSPDHRVWAMIETGLDDAELMVDVVARIIPGAVARWAQTEPDPAARAAIQMAAHLRDMDWQRRSFDYVDVPLRWIRAAAQGVGAAGELGLMEDIATELFLRSEHWDRWAQSRETSSWLTNARGGEATALARALRRSGAGKYFSRYAQPGSAASAEVAHELKRP